MRDYLRLFLPGLIPPWQAFDTGRGYGTLNKGTRSLNLSTISLTGENALGLIWAIPLSAGTVAIAAPWGRHIAWLVGAIDRPNARKRHDQATPRLGGLGAALAVAACVALWIRVDPTALDQCARYWGLWPGAMFMFLIGLYDDLFDLKARHKLVLQILAAAVIWYGGIRVDGLALPWIGHVHLGAVGAALTIVWIVSVTNALNLLDGLDGLAAGTAALASSSFLLIAGHSELGSMLGLMSAVLIGACAMLVVNNCRPPKLFLGDSGSLLLGVLLATMSILATRNPAASLPYSVGAGGEASVRLCLAATPLAVPLVDMLVCVLRRLAMGRSIFAPDRGHIHHMLLAMGFRRSAILALLCAATACCGLAAGLAAHLPTWSVGINAAAAETLVIAVLACGFLLAYRRLGCLSVAMWRRYRQASRFIRETDVSQRNRTARADSTGGGDRVAAPVPPAVQKVSRLCELLGISYLRIEAQSPQSAAGTSIDPILQIGRSSHTPILIHMDALDDGRSGVVVRFEELPTTTPAERTSKELLIHALVTEFTTLRAGPNITAPSLTIDEPHPCSAAHQLPI